MPTPWQRPRVIDELPIPMRGRVLEMLIEDYSSRDISSFLLQHGHKISFAAIARYKRVDLPRHLESARKIQQIQELESPDRQTSDNLATITNASLAADPILSRMLQKYGRYDRWFADAEAKKDYVALTSIDRSETGAIRLHAELTGMLAQPGANQTLVQIVISGNAGDADSSAGKQPQQDADVIDIIPIHE